MTTESDNLRRAYINLRDTYEGYEEGLILPQMVDEAREVLKDASEEYDKANPNAFGGEA